MKIFAVNGSQIMMIHLSLRHSMEHLNTISSTNAGSKIGTSIINKCAKCLETRKDDMLSVNICLDEDEHRFMVDSIEFMRNHVLSCQDANMLGNIKQKIYENEYKDQMKVVLELQEIFDINIGKSANIEMGYSLTEDLFDFLTETTANAKDYYESVMDLPNNVDHHIRCSMILKKLKDVDPIMRSASGQKIIPFTLTLEDISTIHNFLLIFKSNICDRPSWTLDDGVSDYMDKKLEKINSIIDIIGLNTISTNQIDNKDIIDESVCYIGLDISEVTMIYAILLSRVKKFKDYYNMLISRHCGDESKRSLEVKTSLYMTISLIDKLKKNLSEDNIKSIEYDELGESILKDVEDHYRRLYGFQ